jgi:hypothetical protein
MIGAVSYAVRATDQRVTCLRIFADAKGETHMEDVDIKSYSQESFSKTILRCTSRTTLRLRGAIYATYPQVCVRWIGTIRRSVCSYSG